MARGVPSATAVMEITSGEKVSLGGSPKPSSTDLWEETGQDRDGLWPRLGALGLSHLRGSGQDPTQGTMRLLKEL